MSFSSFLFGRKDPPIQSYGDFWNWFLKKEKRFFSVVKNQQDIERGFFDKLSHKLSELKDGFYFLTGMYDDNTVELILTAEGNTRNIVFIEELVKQAPQIDGWKFTALKPALDIKNVSIDMAGLKFNSDNLFFYSNDLAEYPDEIDICVVHTDLTEENRREIENGTYIFLDNYLGELDFVNSIDNLKILGRQEAEKELIPVAKLKDFLTWRQKEFVEKYEGVRYDTQNDQHSIMEATFEDGSKIIAVVNTNLLKWDSKASHPWIAVITLKYDGTNNDGMPFDTDYQSLNEIEERLLQELSDKEGYLFFGRQTAKNERDIYFACKDFRKPSKVFFNAQQANVHKYEISYTIYKDKYWQSFEHFRPN